MSLCIRTIFRITGAFFQQTHLVLCRQNHRLSFIPLLPHQKKRIMCHNTCCIFCRQIKNLIACVLPHCLYCRKNGCQCLSCTCRCLQKQCLFPHNTPVNIRYKFFLPFAIGIRKFQSTNGLLTYHIMMKQKI